MKRVLLFYLTWLPFSIPWWFIRKVFWGFLYGRLIWVLLGVILCVISSKISKHILLRFSLSTEKHKYFDDFIQFFDHYQALRYLSVPRLNFFDFPSDVYKITEILPEVFLSIRYSYYKQNNIVSIILNEEDLFCFFTNYYLYKYSKSEFEKINEKERAKVEIYAYEDIQCVMAAFLSSIMTILGQSDVPSGLKNELIQIVSENNIDIEKLLTRDFDTYRKLFNSEIFRLYFSLKNNHESITNLIKKHCEYLFIVPVELKHIKSYCILALPRSAMSFKKGDF